MRKTLVTLVSVLAIPLLIAYRAVAQDLPDFTCVWILDSVAPPSTDIATTLAVRQSVAQTNVRGEPMKPFFKYLTVTRELVSGSHTETYAIGMTGGKRSGRIGLPSSHERVVWEGHDLVIETGTFTGAAPRTGAWAERREAWSLDASGKIRISIATSSSDGSSGTVEILYRRR